MPIVKPSWRRTLHRTPPELDRASLRGGPDKHVDRGPHQAPRPGARPGARQAHRPGALQPSRRIKPHRTAAETLSLPASCLIALLGRIVTSMAAGPGSSSTGAARPDDPIIATSRWGRPAHQPPHCSPMGISWGSIPQGSPLSNHPSRRLRAQVSSISMCLYTSENFISPLASKICPRYTNTLNFKGRG